jgi:hypothetical protein
MGEFEYFKWKTSMLALLYARGYNMTEIQYLLSWWDGIKAKGERTLVGDDKFEFIVKLSDFPEEYNSFDNWTIRLLLYAPLILRESK